MNQEEAERVARLLSMNKPETAYVETELLLAIMNGDAERATVLAKGMTPRERAEAADEALQMRNLLVSFCDSCDEPITRGRDVPRGEQRVAEWSTSSGSHVYVQSHARCRPQQDRRTA